MWEFIVAHWELLTGGLGLVGGGGWGVLKHIRNRKLELEKIELEHQLSSNSALIERRQDAYAAFFKQFKVIDHHIGEAILLRPGDEPSDARTAVAAFDLARALSDLGNEILAIRLFARNNVAPLCDEAKRAISALVNALTWAERYFADDGDEGIEDLRESFEQARAKFTSSIVALIRGMRNDLIS